MFFFFFKQKTAYEMRISDWSSDVCSSDLFLPADVAASEGLFGIGCHTTLVGGLGDTIRRYPDDDVSAQFRKEFVDVPGLLAERADVRRAVVELQVCDDDDRLARILGSFQRLSHPIDRDVVVTENQHVAVDELLYPHSLFVGQHLANAK